MNDRIPRTKSELVLVDIKAKPSGWPPASLDTDSGRAPQTSQREPANNRNNKLKSLRFQGIAGA
jgi:hypothetical protein